jgi:hypothetical protein
MSDDAAKIAKNLKVISDLSGSEIKQLEEIKVWFNL